MIYPQVTRLRRFSGAVESYKQCAWKYAYVSLIIDFLTSEAKLSLDDLITNESIQSSKSKSLAKC